MKKILIAVATVAMTMTSMAVTSIQIYAEIEAYNVKDKQPSDAHASRYSMYSMTTEDAQQLMGGI